MVEGPSDVWVLDEFLDKKELLKTFNIKIWSLGGHAMVYADLSVFTETYTVVALLDQDPGSGNARERFEKLSREHKIPVHRLKRYSLENYFTLDAIRSVLDISDEVTELLPDKKVEDQLGVDVKRNNRKIVRAMSLDDIAGTDLETFLSEVEDLCQQKP